MKFKHLIYIGISSAILSFAFHNTEYFDYLKDISTTSMCIYCLLSLKFDNLEEKIF